MVLEQFGSIQLIFSKAQAATTPVYQNAQSQNVLQLFFFFSVLNTSFWKSKRASLSSLDGA